MQPGDGAGDRVHDVVDSSVGFDVVMVLAQGDEVANW